MKKAIVIGGGISGLCVSYFLKNKFELLLLEQNDYLGGHSHTHTTVSYTHLTLPTKRIV